MNTSIVRCLSRSRAAWLARLTLGLMVLTVAPAMRGTTVVPPTFAELVNESDYIVRAVVKSVKSAWREKAGQKHIYTQVELEVLEVVNGTPPQPLVLEMLGGRVGDEELVIQGLPKFMVGQEEIFFVRGNGRQFYPLTAAMHGHYPIRREKDGSARVTRSNQMPLHDTAEVAQSMADGAVTPPLGGTVPALTPEQFVQRIRAAVNVNYQPTRRAK